VEFNDAFSVEKPVDQVWSMMLDLERVVPCATGPTRRAASWS
jgi:carbon monoxide dehydrogenase subunit G